MSPLNGYSAISEGGLRTRFCAWNRADSKSIARSAVIQAAKNFLTPRRRWASRRNASPLGRKATRTLLTSSVSGGEVKQETVLERQFLLVRGEIDKEAEGDPDVSRFAGGLVAPTRVVTGYPAVFFGDFEPGHAETLNLDVLARIEALDSLTNSDFNAMPLGELLKKIERIPAGRRQLNICERHSERKVHFEIAMQFGIEVWTGFESAPFSLRGQVLEEVALLLVGGSRVQEASASNNDESVSFRRELLRVAPNGRVAVEFSLEYLVPMEDSTVNVLKSEPEGFEAMVHKIGMKSKFQRSPSMKSLGDPTPVSIRKSPST